MDFKTTFFRKLWIENDKQRLEKWIYQTGSYFFEEVLGEDFYSEIISESYLNKDLEYLKENILKNMPEVVKKEYYEYINSFNGIVKIKCVDTKNYSELKIGKKYVIKKLVINLADNKITLEIDNLVGEKMNSKKLYPVELFKFESKGIPDNYKMTKDNLIIIFEL